MIRNWKCHLEALLDCWTVAYFGKYLGTFQLFKLLSQNLPKLSEILKTSWHILVPLVCWLKSLKKNVIILLLIIKNGYFTFKILKNRSPWASSSGPYLCYEELYLPHSSGLQKASISGSQARSSSMVWPSPLWIKLWGCKLIDLSFKYFTVESHTGTHLEIQLQGCVTKQILISNEACYHTRHVSKHRACFRYQLHI